MTQALPAIGIRYALRDHVASQPFDAYENNDGTPAVDDLAPGARQRIGHGQADHAGADDQAVDAVHGRADQPTR